MQEHVLKHRRATVLSSGAEGEEGSCRKLPGHSEQAATSYSEDRANTDPATEVVCP